MSSNSLKELIKARNILKRKFESLRQGEAENELLLEKTFKPITTPLKNVVERNLLDSQNRKLLNDDLFNNIKTSTPSYKKETKVPKLAKFRNSSFYESFSQSDDEDNNVTDEEGKNADTATGEVEIEKESEGEESQGALSFQNEAERENDNTTQPDERIYHYLKDDAKRDRIFGPTQDYENAWHLAKTPIFFENKSLRVNETKYPLTQGLIELLFLKEPLTHNQNDLHVYKKILEKTSVHKCGHIPTGKIKSSRSNKYKNIIGPLFYPKKNSTPSRKDKSLNKSRNVSQYKGDGIMELQTSKPNYIYWDDPNELVDRLRLLISSTLAGHTGHNNEIESIIEELKEAEIIY